MITLYQFLLIALNGSSINSTLELVQHSTDSLNQLVTILTITFIPLTIILIYTSYLYFSLKYKANKVNID